MRRSVGAQDCACSHACLTVFMLAYRAPVFAYLCACGRAFVCVCVSDCVGVGRCGTLGEQRCDP